jgi:multidrug efflux system membrane fusion protein
MRRWYVPLLLLVGSLAGVVPFAGCSHQPGESGSKAPPKVTVSKPLWEPVTNYEFFTGRLEAVEEVQIMARATGYLKAIYFQKKVEVKEGDTLQTRIEVVPLVHKGDLLYLIDPSTYEADLKKAKAEVTTKKAALLTFKANFERAEKEYNKNAISIQEYENHKGKYEEAKGQVETAEAQVLTATLNLGFTKITAPIEGRIEVSRITEGNLVKADQTLLTTMVSENPIYASFDADENTVLRLQRYVREGRIESRNGREIPVEVGLATDEGYPYKGTFDYTDPKFDRSTGTLRVRAVLPNPKPTKGERTLTPGLFARVRIPIGKPQPALLVTERAIGSDMGQKYLYVLTSKNTVEYRPVELGAHQPDGLRAIEPVKVVRTDKGIRKAESGEKGEDSLTKDERVVVSGLQRVRPGLEVEPVEVPMPRQRPRLEAPRK